MIKWQTADNDAAQAEGVKFLCKHGERLGVPYKWGNILATVICSLFDKGLMIGTDTVGRITGAIVFTLGTRDDKYTNFSKIEVHLLYMEESQRVGVNFVEAIGALARQVLDSTHGIKEIVFCTEPTAGNRRLFGKIATLHRTSEYSCGPLDYFTTTPEALYEYAISRRV